MSRLGQTNRTGTVELLNNPNQQAFLAALEQKTPSGSWAYKLLSLFAGRRGGKTEIGALATVRKMRNAGWLIWVCAPTYRDLKDFVIPTLFKYVPESWVDDWKESDLELTLKNRTRVQMRSLEDPNTARGPGLNFAWLDESRKIAELAWKTMVPALSDKGGQAIFTTTPNGYDWCYETLWREAELGTPGIWACKYRTADAPHFQTPQGRAELDFARRSLDPLFFAQEYEADFVTFAGSIYGGVWDPRLVLDTDADVKLWIPEWPKISPHRPALLGTDPGVDHPFAGTLGVKVPRGIVIVGEYEKRGGAIEDHVQGLAEICSQDNPLEPFAPEQIAIDKTQKIWAMEFQLKGLPMVPANNDVIGGINRVKSWLRMKQIAFVRARVPKLIKSMQGYQWLDEKSPDGQLKREVPKKINDDLPDALRYMLMLWPGLPEMDLPEPTARDAAIAKMSAEAQWALARMKRINEKERRSYEDDEAGLLVYGDDLEPVGEWQFNVEDADLPTAQFFQ